MGLTQNIGKKYNKETGQFDWVWRWYYEYPGAIWFDYYCDTKTKAAAIVGYTIKYNGKTYTGECVEDFVETVNQLRDEYSDLCGVNDVQRRIVVFGTKIRRMWWFLKKYFETDTFSIKGAKLGVLTLDDFFEIREVKAFLGDNWKQMSSSEEMIDILYDDAKRIIDTAIVKTGENKGKFLLTTQQLIAEEIKKNMTDEDFKYVRSLFPDFKWYDIIMNKLFMGGFCDKAFPENPKKRMDYKKLLCFESFGHVDFSASYAARMLLDYVPVTPWVKAPKSRVKEFLRTKCCILKVRFTNIHAGLVSFLRAGKSNIEDGDCIVKRGSGKLAFAKSVVYYLTEKDFELCHMFYTWDNCELLELYVSDKGPLPSFIRTVIEKVFYNRQVSPKNEDGTDSPERLWWKLCTEIGYGTTVKEIHNYKDKKENWKEEVIDRAFLSPYWGIWTSMHARFALLIEVYKMGRDFLYTDTDSIYYKNPQGHIASLLEYNVNQSARMFKYCVENNLDYNIYKDLGCWKWEDGSTPEEPNGTKFCSIGPKRYIYTYTDKDGNEILVVKIAGFSKCYEKNGKKVTCWEYRFDIDELFDRLSDNCKIIDIRPFSDTFEEPRTVTYNGRVYTALSGECFVEDGKDAEKEISIRESYKEWKEEYDMYNQWREENGHEVRR